MDKKFKIDKNFQNWQKISKLTKKFKIDKNILNLPKTSKLTKKEIFCQFSNGTFVD